MKYYLLFVRQRKIETKVLTLEVKKNNYKTTRKTPCLKIVNASYGTFSCWYYQNSRIAGKTIEGARKKQKKTKKGRKPREIDNTIYS